MKWLLSGVIIALLWVPCASAQVSGIKTVYLMPMAGGIDQYLALRLTEEGVFQVVTDPQKAEAVLTDRIGTRFEESFSELYRAPEAKAKEKEASDFTRPTMQPLSSSRGLIFLIDRATRNVLWSTFERPKNTQPDELNRAAEKIVDRLVKAQKSK